MFQDLRWRSIETGFGGFEIQLKSIKFGLWPFYEDYIIDSIQS